MSDKALTVKSPFGPLTLFADDSEIIRLRWGSGGHDTSGLLVQAAGQLDQYFAGKRRVFDLPLRFLSGLTGEVQREMVKIPIGETRTYGDIAKALKTNPQAVGQACGANEIPILIPCHRVLGQAGLGGFSAPGGVETKVALLKLEGAGSLLI